MKVLQRGPVLYVDWEADAFTHARRLKALAAGYGLAPPDDLHYVEAQAPLRVWARALARQAARLDAALVVIDSVMLARGGEAATEDTVAFFGALRTLGRETLLLDHKSREAIKAGTGGAYGSVVNDNTVRLQWDARGEEGTIVLRPHKKNNYLHLPTIALTLDATGPDGQMTEARWQHTTPPPPPESIEVGVRGDILDHLRLDDGLTVATLSARSGRHEGSLRKALAALAADGAVHRYEGRWYLTPEDDLRLPDPM
jgi:hypothetical protein